ncbi:MAG: holo-[acyl-carrier-protein] synthase [Spirochaetia bacterium]|nr:holo-[acyl-carrier-protein] synthase [Spirochaetia bacterium]
MKINVGNDLIENSRIREALEKFGERFLEKVFTPSEIEYCMKKKDPIPHLSARFSCKEAFIKAIDLPDGVSIDFREIELSGSNFGKKKLSLFGKAKEFYLSQGFSEHTVSVTHTETVSGAVVILYEK